MSHPLLSLRALPHEVSIYSGVAGEMVSAIASPSDPLIAIPSQLDNERPLDPLPARQTIPRLPEEPRSTSTQWIHTTPEQFAASDQLLREKRAVATLSRTNHVAMEMTDIVGSIPVDNTTPADLLTLDPTMDIRHCFELHPRAPSWQHAMERQL